MIDTVKVHVPITCEAADALERRAVKLRSVVDLEEGAVVGDWQRLDCEWFVPSYSGSITYQVKREERFRFSLDFPLVVQFEFSLPKVLLGHNVGMVWDWKTGLERFRARLLLDFRLRGLDVAPVDSWRLMRIDVCYAYEVGEETAQALMERVRRACPPRKQTSQYDNGVLHRGRAYSVKAYLKGPEFLKNQVPKLVKLGREELLREWLPIAQGVFRVEASIRQSGLEKLFERKFVLVRHVDEDFPLERLRFYLRKWGLAMRIEDSSDLDVRDRLRRKYGETNGKAANLYGFYLAFESLGKEGLLQMVSESTFYRNKRALEDAGVSLVDPYEELAEELRDFRFEVPSKYGVNNEDLDWIIDEDGGTIPGQLSIDEDEKAS